MRSDKQQMSYVPQTTEHISVTSMSASGGATGTRVIDVTVPPECIIEKVEVALVNSFAAATSVTLNIGSSANTNLFTPTAITLSGAGTNAATAPAAQAYATPQVLMTPVSSLAADRIVRFTFTNSDAVNGDTGNVVCYVVYRFAPNGTPTRVA
jgi:hypothetical protein